MAATTSCYPDRCAARLAGRRHACGVQLHTQGELGAAIHRTRHSVDIRTRYAGPAQAAPDAMWLGYEYLCLAKRPNPLTPIRLLLLPFYVMTGCHLMQAAVRTAAVHGRQELQAKRAYYTGDLLHSWGNILMLGGPRLVRWCRWVFRLAADFYGRASSQAPFMGTGYYWLRQLEASLLSGREIDRETIESRLDELDQSYRLTQNYVQQGNVAAYRGLIAFVLDDDQPRARGYPSVKPRRLGLRQARAWHLAPDASFSSGVLLESCPSGPP